MYFANASAVLFRGRTKIDFGKNFIDKKPVFGSGKTLRGTLCAILVGILASALIMLFFRNTTNNYVENYLFAGALLSIGAVFGDIAASFLKRRLNLPQGKEFFPLDQLDFVIGGLLFASFVLPNSINPSVEEIVLILIISPIIHRAANFLAFKFKLKNVPW